MSTIRLGDFELDAQTGELRGRDTNARLQDKPLQVLLLLLESPGALVTREQIRDRIWGPSRYHDFEDSLNQAVRKLREAFGDSAMRPSVIETIPRRGYRLVADVDNAAAMPHKPQQALAHATVGRDTELQLLRSLFDEVAQGRGRIVCISGEPGIGKTTLASVLIQDLRSTQASRIGIGRCSERFGGAEAYLPILEALENLLRAERGSNLIEILRATAPTWFAEMPADLTSAIEPLLNHAPIATQERRKREFSAFLTAAASDKPLLLFLDDLHWADVSSVDLLAYAVPRCSESKVLIVGTYRPADMARSDHPFLEAKREMQAHRLCREIELSRLRPDDVGAFIDVEFPSHTFPPDFIAAIHTRTDGYPLFLVDLLQDLKKAGWISLVGSTWTLNRELEQIENLPDSVRAMVDRQIGHLSAAHRSLLEVASVEGSRFHSKILASVLQRTTTEIEDDLDEIEAKHGMIRFSADELVPGSSACSRYAFTHTLYMNALYGGLRASRRASLSLSVAEALLDWRGPAANEAAAHLAHLFEAAGEWHRSSTFYGIAAANAAKLSAYRESVDLSLRAIDMAKRIDGQQRERQVLEATLQLGKLKQALSHFEESVPDFEAAEALAKAIGDVEAQVEAICGAAYSVGYMKRTAEMRDRSLRAIEIAEAAGVSAAYPQSVLGFQQIFVGELSESRRNHERALSVLLKQKPSQHGVFSAVSFGFLNDLQSEYQRADDLLSTAMQQIESTGSWFELLRASWFHGMVLANLGRLGDALRTLTKAMELAELNGETFWYSRYPNTIGWIYGEMADHESSLRLNTEGVRAGIIGGTPESEANAHINLVNTYVALGDLTHASEHLTEGASIVERDNHKHWLRWRFRIRLELAQSNYALAVGDFTGARKAAESALLRAEGVLARKHAADARRLLGEAAVGDKRLTEAASHYDAGLGILRKYPCPMIEWRLLRAASALAQITGGEKRSEHLLARSNELVYSLRHKLNTSNQSVA